MKGDKDCTLCRLHMTTTNVCILGNGPTPNEVMIIGEAPGESEEKRGEAFVGASGKLLRKYLEKYDLADAFITNAVSCRPPDNRTPSKGEISKCRTWLDFQIKRVKPKFVLLLGNTPLMSITGKAGVTSKRGRPFIQDGVIFMPTFHPAYCLRDPTQEETFEADIKSFSDIVEAGEIPRENKLRPTLVRTMADFERVLPMIEGVVSFDIETNGLYPWQTYTSKIVKGVEVKTPHKPRITMIGFGTANGEISIPLHHRQSPFNDDAIDYMLTKLTERLVDCLIVTHNGKFDYLWMLVIFGLDWYRHAYFDTMLAHYLLDENDRHGLKYLAMKFLGAPDWEIDKDTKTGEGPIDQLFLYHAHDLYYTRALRYKFGKMLKEDIQILDVFNKILMPCVRLFVEIEYDGIYVDVSKFEDAEKYLRDQYNTALKNLKKWEPTPELDRKGNPIEFNWGSSQQLAHLLFDILELPVVELTKAGGRSCSESVIKRIDHPCTGDLLKFREAKQQLSFFIDGWKPFLHRKREGGEWVYYLHPSFKLHGTVTGRLSCEHPNLQQVPRDPRIRSLITAGTGWTLVECDLSQIELRVAAHLADEVNMIYAFNNNVDAHWLTAIGEISRGGGLAELVLDTARTWKQDKTIKYAEAIEILLEMGPDAAADINPQWKEYRKRAKAINFGYLYGMWWKKFKLYARDNYGVEIDDEGAQASRVSFFQQYPDFPKWHEKQRQFARRNGYVRSLSGRKRRLPKALLRDNTPERQEAERQSINSPVQSFANELNLMAAIQLREEYGRDVVKICGTVHDAILMRVRDDMVSEVVRRLLVIMSHPKLLDELRTGIDLKVPIEAEAKVGAWSKGVNLDKWEKEHGRGNARVA